MKLTKTDHHEQALVLMPRTKCLIREGMEAITNDSRLPIELRDDALQLQRALEDSSLEDHPAIFLKSHGNMTNCTQCLGTGTEKIYDPDTNAEPEYIPCSACKGEGQLYLEVIRKFYVPTDYHRRKLAK